MKKKKKKLKKKIKKNKKKLHLFFLPIKNKCTVTYHPFQTYLVFSLNPDHDCATYASLKRNKKS